MIHQQTWVYLRGSHWHEHLTKPLRNDGGSYKCLRSCQECDRTVAYSEMHGIMKMCMYTYQGGGLRPMPVGRGPLNVVFSKKLGPDSDFWKEKIAKNAFLSRFMPFGRHFKIFKKSNLLVIYCWCWVGYERDPSCKKVVNTPTVTQRTELNNGIIDTCYN